MKGRKQAASPRMQSLRTSLETAMAAARLDAPLVAACREALGSAVFTYRDALEDLVAACVLEAKGVVALDRVDLWAVKLITDLLWKEHATLHEIDVRITSYHMRVLIDRAKAQQALQTAGAR
jgi:hypothetical protein